MPLLSGLDVYAPLRALRENKSFVIGLVLTRYFDTGEPGPLLTPMNSLIIMTVALLAILAVLVIYHAKKSPRMGLPKRYPSLKDLEDLADAANMCAACREPSAHDLPCHRPWCKDGQEMESGATKCPTCSKTTDKLDWIRLRSSIMDPLLHAQMVMKVARSISGLGPLLFIGAVEVTYSLETPNGC